MVDKERIKFESTLDLSFINKTAKAKSMIKKIKTSMDSGDIWVIKSLGIKFSLKDLIDFLFKYDLDVFDIEVDGIWKIYICKLDDYRITDRVVHAWKAQI